MKRSIIFSAAAAVLLTGCTGLPTQNSEPDVTQAQTEAGTDDAAVSTAAGESAAQTSAADSNAVTATGNVSTPSFIIVTAAPATYPPISTENTQTLPLTAAATTAATITTAAAASTTAPTTAAAESTTTMRDISYYTPISIPDSILHDEISLKGTGRVHASSGLKLRQTPNGNQITTLADGSNVEILGVKIDGELSKATSRWYKVKANGKEGYACAEYIAAKFTQKLDELTPQQVAAISGMMFYQQDYLFTLFAYDGGFKGTGFDSNDTVNYNDEHFERMLPKNLKLSEIYDDFYQYFLKLYHENELTDRKMEGGGSMHYLYEKDGKVYRNTGYGDNTWFKYAAPDTVRDTVGAEIVMTGRWYCENGYNENEELGYTPVTVSFVYDGGYWKVGKESAHVY